MGATRGEGSLTMESWLTDEEIQITRHAIERLRQRGYQGGDLGLVLEVGTPMGNSVFVRNQDVDSLVVEYRQRIQKLERIRGTAVILAHGQVLSVHRPRRSKFRRLLRTRHGRGLGVPRASAGEPPE
jgi:hypothetical protein